MWPDTTKFPESEWKGLRYHDFLLYMKTKLEQAEWVEFRRLIHELAEDPATGDIRPSPGTLATIADLACWEVHDGAR